MNFRISSVASAVAVLCLLAEPVHAQSSMRVQCPLDDARRTITNSLPAGWWTTPIVNGLSDTRVQVIARRRSLVCVYGESGTIQRHEPEGYTCSAVRGGFNCRGAEGRPPLANPGTHSTGQVDVPQTYMVDLDEGRVGRAGADLWFEAETRQLLYLTPQNGAGIWVGDHSNRGYAGCSRGNFTAVRVPVSERLVGSYICLRTDAGRISQFRVNAVSSDTPKTLSLGYTTWNR